MSIRIACPACKKVNKVPNEKRGKKVRCSECDEIIRVPADRERDEEAVQEKSKVSVKTSKSKRADEDDDAGDRRRKSRNPSASEKSGSTTVLLIVGIAAVCFLCLAGGGGAIAIYTLREKPDLARNDDLAQDDRNKKPAANQAVEPNELAADQVARIKQATAYLRVTMPSGQVAEGSGFFAVEPGIVITNAHVLGMLGAKSPPPRTVQVVLNSGEVNERQMIGNVLGVDRACDLAVVRVADAGLPAPLQLEANEPVETQKVYIFGFPFGAVLGKNITVSASAVSSLRRDPQTRELDRIQVNGGMHPGNSGGPDVNMHGRLLGVSVAGIPGTQINFAVPAEKVRLIMEGRLAGAKHGEAYRNGGQTLLPVQFTCLDPLNRVQKMHVDVWAGAPGQPKPPSKQKPPPQPGDGQRQSYPMIYRNAAASIDVPLPPAGAGQVHWVQPAITTAAGVTHWGPALPAAIVAPLDRRNVDLRVKLLAEKERTVRIKASSTSTLFKGKEKKSFAEVLQGEYLEVLTPDPKGAFIRTGIGDFQVSAEEDGRQVAFDPDVPPYLRAIPPQFVVDDTNKLRARVDRSLGKTKMAPLLREQVEDNYSQFCNAIEAVNVPMPNRMMRPADTWIAEVPMMLQTGKPPEVADLVLRCTFEGVRTRNQRDEAVISLAGNVRGRGPHANKVAGDITGRLTFDLSQGYIAEAQLKISTERAALAGELMILFDFDIGVTRLPGNIARIAMPVEKPNPPPGSKGK